MFENNQPRTIEDKRRRRGNALKNFQKFIKPFTQYLTGEEKFDTGTKFIFDALQDPIINKQLAMQLFDQIMPADQDSMSFVMLVTPYIIILLKII